MNFISQITKDIFNLIYPNICEGCGEELVGNENMICISCWQAMPKTNFHLQINNPIEQKLLESVNIQHGCAMYYFNKETRIQGALHALKYKNNKEIGLELGEKYGIELESCGWIKEIDVLIPIPLSKQKMKLRGYNQSELITKGIHNRHSIPIDIQSVIRKKNTKSQTTMSITERLNNVSNAFEVLYPLSIEGKHVLLIDDVFTTGATLASCAKEILKIRDSKVSILTLAYAIV